ncbi:MAG: hypothetical protein PUJ51_05885 [Clostridiales bacterium]|uniref:hypothetical protein n=1 Tax=Terrisporobacter sp. TaxID=1965305 RepID=UPI002A589B06|nr:hypothetical protein [Terrisporobacter sp.]MDD7754021.1 hypothetical protein [Clostridiales bacterium]MDY4133722.1 hypothetical protein [Terrisporobacter sp.]
MNLWVRSQDKRILQKVDNIFLDANYENKRISTYDGDSVELGTYKTKERAIEVLDEIQMLLQPTIEYKPIVQEEYNPAYKYKHFVKVDDNIEIKELSTFVYQMPEN